MPSAGHLRHRHHGHHHILLLLLLGFSFLLRAQLDYPSANLSTIWTNDPSQLPHTVSFEDGSQVRSILLRRSPNFFGPTFACGFYCKDACTSFLFAVFAVYTNSGGGITMTNLAPPQVVWSANRDRLVGTNATLHLTAGGDLILRGADGTAVWSAGTSGRSVVGMNITESGNLVLFDQDGKLVWQSFDHPTDSLVLGQTLKEGQRLSANTSMTNWTRGQYTITGIKTTKNSTYIKYLNGSLAMFTQSGTPDESISLPAALSLQFMRFESDGSLKLYNWSQGWQVIADVLHLDVCAYPTVCGEYGICSNGQCSCPSGVNGSIYFRLIDDRKSNLGCSPVNPLSCQSRQEHDLLPAHDVSYFSYVYGAANFRGIDEESCKQACLKNCSCRAALFQYSGNVSDGNCFLPSQLFSLQNNQPSTSHYNSSAYIKVQNFVVPPASNNTKKRDVGIGVSIGIIGAGLIASLIGGMIIRYVRRKRSKEEEEDDFQQVPGMPTRFTFEDLKLATENFSKKLGEGGFGTVYQGKIGDEEVAVKRLDGVGQGKREFLAEVETIGSIHHINLVRLIGFCAEKSHRLLVYEYMCNGSLDRWIFSKGQHGTLNWHTKHKIIVDIAKGLSYLHEECRQRIAHLDIKPQNILLDDRFNAKVSDFGLSKLIDRDQEQVMTRMRGTPGYLAPEWLTSIITEKVDIYSFGVVITEIVCGRKNLDYSQPEESIHLISLLQEMIESDRLEDIIDAHSNTKLHAKEAIEMIKLAVWCLQRDSKKRPSMSTVVKVLEGARNVETDLDYNFFANTPIMPTNRDHYDYHLAASPAPSASLLSGPR
ncbi:G-type lectin S-receptor-like serine threonine-protein kinase SD2-5-like [Musa troglodytarum]|uniref:Receptor-like serine/threonine-protein kinase n=1 Tax=Musa troglodytarum TaxID=320322 RepID=A0A9E7K8D6_9LILI|nr:G-type lectin S-receptor-like serine threonine-protein kinase SD2-5-like [Musa troglodytarum]